MSRRDAAWRARRGSVAAPGRLAVGHTGGGIPGAAWLGLALVLVAATWLHRDALRAPFFADDYAFLDAVRGRSLTGALTGADPLGNYFRPVGRQLWFWLIAHGGGASPWVAHALGLGLFLTSITLLFVLVTGAAGPWAGLVAASVLSLHHAADVPLLWVSGAQDLIAVTGALGALVLFQRGRAGGAAVSLALGLLAKETVALTPVVAVLFARPPGERADSALKRAWPLFATAVAWAAVWLVTLPSRAGFAAAARLDPRDLPAALVGATRAAFGIEWSTGGEHTHVAPSDLAAVALVVVALFVAAWGGGAWTEDSRRASPRSRAGSAGTRGAAVGALMWAVLAALPVAAVMPIWSAYHFLYAVCGVAAVIGVMVTGAGPVIAIAVVAILAIASAQARALPGFATRPGAFTAQSHVDRAYLLRGMSRVGHVLAELKRLRPTLPPRSTLLFAGVPANIAFQTGNGPLVRWAYRDSTLRSRFIRAFRIADATRGPVFFFEMSADTLREVTGADSLRDLGCGLLVGAVPEAARDLLTLRVRDHPSDALAWYPLGLVRLATGDESGGLLALRQAGLATNAGPVPEIGLAFRALAAGDTTRAVAITRAGVAAHALDPGVHALLADLELTRDRLSYDGALEAYAVTTLARGDPAGWRRWALALAVRGSDAAALEALERYEALAGPSGEVDSLSRSIRAQILPRLPGGSEAQRAVSTDTSP
ncbi:MAG: hypothetical protein ACHQ52_04795 [Candidatus Eisenbacteria bacterium]